jgi:hypothetical protein
MTNNYNSTSFEEPVGLRNKLKNKRSSKYEK